MKGAMKAIFAHASQLIILLIPTLFLDAAAISAAQPDDKADNKTTGAKTTGAKTTGAYKSRLIGVGEPRDPQLFTHEQRLLQAARDGDLSIITRALELGVDVNTKDDLGRSPLLLATRNTGALDLVRFLRSRGAQVDIADADGRTPISFAAAKGKFPIVNYLVAEGAVFDRIDNRGRTPLYYAAVGNHIDTTAFLIGKGADINIRDKFQDSILMMTCTKGHGKMVRLLLDRGANPTLRDQEGRTVRERAAHVPACLEQLPKLSTDH